MTTNTEDLHQDLTRDLPSISKAPASCATCVYCYRNKPGKNSGYIALCYVQAACLTLIESVEEHSPEKMGAKVTSPVRPACSHHRQRPRLPDPNL